MTNKYIREGETYNGDGTSSAAATLDGGAGAWNNFYDIFTGTAPTYGTLNDGDVVNIKTTDETDADFSYNYSTDFNIGKPSGDVDNPVTWLFDDGTIWSGKEGVITFHKNTKDGYLTFLPGTIIHAKDYNLVFDATTVTNGNSNKGLRLSNTLLIGVKIDWSTIVSNYGPRLYLGSGNNNHSTLIDCWVLSGNKYAALFAEASYNTGNIIGCKIELVIAQNEPVFQSGNYGSQIMVLGGEISGTGTSTGQIAEATTTGGAVFCQGLIAPITMDINKNVSTTRVKESFHNSMDGGLGSAYLNSGWGKVDSFGSYPYLNADKPDSAEDGYSLKVYPRSASKGSPAVIQLAVPFTDTAAAKTFTIEFLANDSMDIPTKDLFYAVVEYKQDSDGQSKQVNSYDPTGASSTTSTASWSTTSYDGDTFSKHKIVLTTPTSIEKDTVVNIAFISGIRSGSSTDVYFVDPEVVVS